jgi:hypothetical protein
MIDIKKEEKSGKNQNFKSLELQFYSDYGYIKVLKSEFESAAQIINCYKDDKKLQATIKV